MATLDQMTRDQMKALNILREAYHTPISYHYKGGTLQPADDAACMKARNKILVALAREHNVPETALESLLSLPPMVLSGLVDDPYPYPIDDAPPPTAPAVAPPPVPVTKAVAPPVVAVTPVTPVTPPVSPVTKAAPVVSPTPAAVVDPASTPEGTKATWSKRKETLVGIAEDGSPITMAYGTKVLWDHDTSERSTSVRYVESLLMSLGEVIRAAGLSHRYNIKDFDLRAMVAIPEDELDAIGARAVADLKACDVGPFEECALRCVICAVELVRQSRPSFEREATGLRGWHVSLHEQRP